VILLSVEHAEPYLLERSTQVRIGEAQLEIKIAVSDQTEIIQLEGLEKHAAGSQSSALDKLVKADGKPAVDKGTHIFTVPPSQPTSPRSSNSNKSNSVKSNSSIARLEAKDTPPENDSCTTLDHSCDPSLPRIFRDYNILKSIGMGGMGHVFLANRVARKEPVALKFLKPQGNDSDLNRARFLREMEITSSLQHSSIVQLIECGDEDGQLFIAMEYCNGGNLAELLRRTRQLTFRRAVRLMDRLLAGVELAHAEGIVHRDLKPQNIILHKDSAGKFRPKITDFGLAKSYLQAGESGMTTNGTVGGSWPYMPMEQLTNFRFVSPSSDVWSLGAIFYESITGRLPREHHPGMDPIRAILNSRIIPLEQLLPSAPVPLSRFIYQCLDDDATKRFANGAAMRVALRNLASKLEIEL
jgi:tRNA A-37 threonylcarbamoyl transferase component Bud32